MINWYKSLTTGSKVLVGICAVLGVLTVACIIAVLATGGFTNPF